MMPSSQEVDQILKGRMPIITREMVQHCIKTTRETGISRFGHKPTPFIRPAETPLKSMKDGYFVAGYLVISMTSLLLFLLTLGHVVRYSAKPC